MINCCSRFVFASCQSSLAFAVGLILLPTIVETLAIGKKCRHLSLFRGFSWAHFADLMCNTCAVWAPFQIPLAGWH
jgi:hypothetical protein